MSLDDRHLLEAWRERPAGAGPAECPDPERIWRAVALESPEEERRQLIDHLAGCASCAQAWRLAAGLAGPAMAPEPAARSSWLPRAMLAAASIVAVVGLGWLALHRSPIPGTALRATEPAILSLLDEGSALPRDRFQLRWSPGPPGTIYDVEVGTSDLRLLSRAMALVDPEYLVPPQAFQDVASGTVIAWRVEATLPDGRVVAGVTHLNIVR